jgi:hypothetical protein
MTERPPTLPGRFGVTRAEDKANLSLSGPYIPQEELPLERANDWDALVDLAQSVAGNLAKVRDACTALPLTFRERDAALASLRSIGTTMISRIMGKYRSSPLQLGPGTLAHGERYPPILDVEIVCSTDLVLPAELLPLLRPCKPVDETKPSESLEWYQTVDANFRKEHGLVHKGGDPLHDAAAMLGFGATCHRAVERTAANDALLDPRAVRFYWDARLEGAKRQWNWFAERDRRGPHPAKGEDSGAVVNWIVRKERQARTGGLVTCAVEHFHCHHVRANQPGAEDIVRLKSTGWWRPEVEVHAGQLAGGAFREPPAAGFVFLNACSSQFVSPRAVGSFAREFLLNGRNAVVTTWCDVPDNIGYAMASRFYEAFFRGETVGAALREARLRLLLDQKNPLGLLYTVYGDSRFRLPDAATRPNGEGAET